MRTITSLHVEDLETRAAPAIGSIPFVGGVLAVEHNPNVEPVYCITDPCPPHLDPGAARYSVKVHLIMGNRIEASDADSVSPFQLQQAVNRDSEQFQALTNIQQAKKQAQDAAIQNVRG